MLLLYFFLGPISSLGLEVSIHPRHPESKGRERSIEQIHQGISQFSHRKNFIGVSVALWIR